MLHEMINGVAYVGMLYRCPWAWRLPWNKKRLKKRI